MTGFHYAFAVGAIIAVIGIVAALTLIRPAELEQPDSPLELPASGEVDEPVLELAA